MNEVLVYGASDGWHVIPCGTCSQGHGWSADFVPSAAQATPVRCRLAGLSSWHSGVGRRSRPWRGACLCACSWRACKQEGQACTAGSELEEKKACDSHYHFYGLSCAGAVSARSASCTGLAGCSPCRALRCTACACWWPIPVTECCPAPQARKARLGTAPRRRPSPAAHASLCAAAGPSVWWRGGRQRCVVRLHRSCREMCATATGGSCECRHNSCP